VSYDGEGYPDLHMLRPSTGHEVAAELKVKNNKPTEKQLEWLDQFQQCETPAFVWYPSDVEEIKAVLRNGIAPLKPLGTDLEKWRRVRPWSLGHDETGLDRRKCLRR